LSNAQPHYDSTNLSLSIFCNEYSKFHLVAFRGSGFWSTAEKQMATSLMPLLKHFAADIRAEMSMNAMK
jgi:hypothetical protein